MAANMYLPVPEGTAGVMCALQRRDMLLYTTLKPTDLAIRIDERAVNVAQDICGKFCKHFKSRPELEEMFYNQHGRKPTGLPELKQFGAEQEVPLCIGGEHIIREKQCLMNVDYNKAAVAARTANIKTPPGLTFIKAFGWSRSASGANSITYKGGDHKGWHFKVLRQTPEGIGASVYRISNVWGDGRVCWGTGNRSEEIKDPRKAFDFFFGSPFNGDLLGTGISGTLKQTMEAYNPLSAGYEIDDAATACMSGEPFVAVNPMLRRSWRGIRVPMGNCGGVLLATSPNFVQLAPEWARVNIPGEIDLVVARATLTPTGIAFSFGDGKVHVTTKKTLTAKTQIMTYGPELAQLASARVTPEAQAAALDKIKQRRLEIEQEQRELAQQQEEEGELENAF